jgi:uncharacterized protein
MTKVRDNPDKGRFELDLGGQVVFARYARHGSVLVIPHVEAPPALRGTGAAGQLSSWTAPCFDRTGSVAR